MTIMTTILAECPYCQKEIEARILGCDTCYEHFLDLGGKEEEWDDLACEHYRCLECGEDFN